MTHTGIEAKRGESHLDASLRSLIITASNDDQVNEKCMEIMKNFFNNSVPVDPEIRGSIYQVYVSKGGLEACNNMVDLHKNIESIQEKRDIEIALSCVKGLECLKTAQQFIILSRVHDNEKYEILKGMATGSKLGRDESWKFVKEQWKALHSESHQLSRIIEVSTESFATEEMLEEVRNFLNNKIKCACDEKDQHDRNCDTKLCIDRIRFNIQLWKKTGQNLKEYFK